MPGATPDEHSGRSDRKTERPELFSSPEIARDLASYAAEYAALPFEAHQARYRRGAVLRTIARAGARRILEVGCGLDPVFTSIPELARCVIVDPAEAFAERARELAHGDSRVSVHCATIEHVAPTLAGEGFDVVLLSALLHEVDDPDAVLAAVRPLVGPDTIVHVNVPNASSIHRLLAVRMGLAETPFALSAQQVRLQQRRVFDIASLERLIVSAGLRLIERGGILVKPFTHKQMAAMIDAGIIDQPVLDGLDGLARDHPELASEIFINAAR